MRGAFRFLNELELTTYVELQPVQNHSSQGAAAVHRLFIIKEFRRNARRLVKLLDAECCFPASEQPDRRAADAGGSSESWPVRARSALILDRHPSPPRRDALPLAPGQMPGR
jgi:hypothetical protein